MGHRISSCNGINYSCSEIVGRSECTAVIGRSLSLQRPPSSIILGTRGLESICTWAVPSPWDPGAAPFGTPPCTNGSDISLLYHAPKLEPTVHFASAPQTAPKLQNGLSNVPVNVTDLQKPKPQNTPEKTHEQNIRRHTNNTHASTPPTTQAPSHTTHDQAPKFMG